MPDHNNFGVKPERLDNNIKYMFYQYRFNNTSQHNISHFTFYYSIKKYLATIFHKYILFYRASLLTQLQTAFFEKVYVL